LLGLAASLFPAIILFDKKMNKEGAIADYRLTIDAFLYAEIQIWTFDGGLLLA
jgi:Na+(H+)/acetate symporter ActP